MSDLDGDARDFVAAVADAHDAAVGDDADDVAVQLPALEEARHVGLVLRFAMTSMRSWLSLSITS